MDGEDGHGAIYEVLLVKDRKVRRVPRLLRAEEVADFLDGFNRHTETTGITAQAKELRVSLTRLNGDFDGEW